MKIYEKVVMDIETGKILEEVSYNYNGIVAECGGSKTVVQPPQPTAEEMALQAKQAETLDIQNKLLQQQLEETQKTRAMLEQFGPRSEADWQMIQELNRKELELAGQSADINRQILARLSGEGLTPEEKKYEEMQQRIGLLQAGRLEKALKGELPISVGTQQAKASEFKNFKEVMARGGNPVVGDTPETATALTTPAIQALNEFKKRWQAFEDAESKGEIERGSGLLLQRMGLTSDIGARNFDIASSYKGVPAQTYNFIASRGMYGYPEAQRAATGLLAGYESAQQPYLSMRQLQYQADINAAMQKAANRAGLLSGLMQLGGTLGGAYLMRRK